MHAYLIPLVALLLAAPLFAADPAPALQKRTERESPDSPTTRIKIPPFESLTLDANPQKWSTAGFRVDVLNEADPHPGSDQNLPPSLRLAWTLKGLAIFVQVHDTTPDEADKIESLWEKDSVEFVLSDPAHPGQILQFLVAPGMDPTHPKLRTYLHDFRHDQTTPAKPTIEAASTKTPDGYILEALIPFANLNLDGKLGTRLGFQINVTDSLPGGQKAHYRWGTAELSFKSDAPHHPLILADAPSEPVTYAMDGNYQAFRRYRVRICSTEKQPQKLSLQNNSAKEIAALQYTGGRDCIDLPYPEVTFTDTAGKFDFSGLNAFLTHLTLLADGKSVAQLAPAQPPSRQEAAEQLRIRCSGYAFSGTTLPTFDLEDPIAAEDLLGSYSITTRYFDAHLNQVTSAQNPGPYAAVIHITGTHIASDKGPISADRIFTLYRYPEKIGRRDTLEFTAQDLALPKQFGIRPAVVATQSATILETFKRNFLNDLSRSDDSAILLAALAATAEGEPPYVDRTSPASLNAICIHDLRKKLGLPAAYKYLEHLPPNYAADKETKFPLIIYLHGSGERGDNLNALKANGLVAYLEKHPDFPAVVLSPQCPRNTWWQPTQVNDLIDAALAQYRVDPDRVYLTGLSMGGYGTWAYAAWYPEKLAAAVPICGIGDIKDVARLKNLPLWAFHGEADSVVPCPPDRACADALKALGGNVQFTAYPNVDHDSWTQTYNNPELYTWLLAQSRKPH